MKWIASILGIGYIKGGGTIAAAFAVLLWFFIFNCITSYNLVIALALNVITFFIGVYVGNKVEPYWGKDSSKVVIDEVSGMFITLIAVPLTWQWLLTAFILFRVYDIAKPFYIRRLEKIKGGWGVMMDDVAAGVYASISLHILMLVFN
jgi:phosphatidylglycerophosphatase A